MTMAYPAARGGDGLRLGEAADLGASVGAEEPGLKIGDRRLRH